MGPSAGQPDLRPFVLPGVNLFSGNELDPTDQPDAALIFGGDGTVHRHLAGLSLKQIPTLVVPLGSANDFAQSIGIENPQEAVAAWKRFRTSGDNLRSIDLGTIEELDERCRQDITAEWQPYPAPGFNPPGSTEADDPWRGESLETLHFVPDGARRDLPQMGERIMQSQLRHLSEANRDAAHTCFFCCIAGTGLDAAINRRALKQSPWLRGHGGYILALLQTLGGFRPPRMTLAIENDGSWRTHIDEAGFLIAAGNGPQYGHGMRLTHRARMDDGLLDVCFVRTLSKLRLLRLFRVVYRGEHIGMKEVEYFRTARLRIVSDPMAEVFADGEYVCKTPVEIGVRRNALRVIVPAESL